MSFGTWQITIPITVSWAAQWAIGRQWKHKNRAYYVNKCVYIRMVYQGGLPTHSHTYILWEQLWFTNMISLICKKNRLEPGVCNSGPCLLHGSQICRLCSDQCLSTLCHNLNLYMGGRENNMPRQRTCSWTQMSVLRVSQNSAKSIFCLCFTPRHAEKRRKYEAFNLPARQKDDLSTFITNSYIKKLQGHWGAFKQGFQIIIADVQLQQIEQVPPHKYFCVYAEAALSWTAHLQWIISVVR